MQKYWAGFRFCLDLLWGIFVSLLGMFVGVQLRLSLLMMEWMDMYYDSMLYLGWTLAITSLVALGTMNLRRACLMPPT